jgi:hypothetical protein
MTLSNFVREDPNLVETVGTRSGSNEEMEQSSLARLTPIDDPLGSGLAKASPNQ